MNGTVRILVVDDEQVVRQAFERILGGEFAAVECARDGQEALRRLAEQTFDVVLLDLRMPGMDGITVLRRIKEQQPECQVVVITGYPEIETAKQSVALGAFDYLSKPVGPEDVIQVTNGAVRQKRWALQREAALHAARA